MPQDNSEGKRTLQEIHEIHEVSEVVPRRWPVIVAYLWAAFLVALVVVFGGRWVYDSINEDVKQSSGQQVTGGSTDKNKGAVIVPANPGSGKVSQPQSSTKKPSPVPISVPGTGDDTDLPDVIPSTGG